jgi:hypothetical protein
MSKSQRTTLALGVVLVLAGALFIAANFYQPLHAFIQQMNSWPMIIEAVAVGLLLLGLLIGEPGMAIPAVIVGGIGAILWWQNATGHWESWAYMWTLIPGFSGLGILLARLVGGGEKYNLWSALNTIGTSLVLFVIFCAFFGGFNFLGNYWPVVLIVAGLLLGLRTFIRNR